MYQLGVITSEMFAENAYILWQEGQHNCVLVDPGFDSDEILAFLEKNRLTPEAILNTHGHADHIAGNGAIKRAWPNSILVIGEKEQTKLTDPEENLSEPFGFSIVSPVADRTVREGDVVNAAGFQWEVYETPGHSTGHVVFLWKGTTPWLAVVGDVLMRRSVGRTDFPGGDWDQLMASIEHKLFTLPDDTIVLPGHGESTTIGEERRLNPFVGQAARQRQSGRP